MYDGDDEQLPAGPGPQTFRVTTDRVWEFEAASTFTVRWFADGEEMDPPALPIATVAQPAERGTDPKAAFP